MTVPCAQLLLEGGLSDSAMTGSALRRVSKLCYNRNQMLLHSLITRHVFMQRHVSASAKGNSGGRL